MTDNCDREEGKSPTLISALDVPLDERVGLSSPLGSRHSQEMAIIDFPAGICKRLGEERRERGE